MVPTLLYSILWLFGRSLGYWMHWGFDQPPYSDLTLQKLSLISYKAMTVWSMPPLQFWRTYVWGNHLEKHCISCLWCLTNGKRVDKHGSAGHVESDFDNQRLLKSVLYDRWQWHTSNLTVERVKRCLSVGQNNGPIVCSGVIVCPYLTGYRLGYLAAPKDIVKAASKLQSQRLGRHCYR